MSPAWRRVGRIARALVLIYGGVLALLWVFQDRLIYPAPGPRQPWGTLVVQRPDGPLRGWTFRPESSEALVVFGGNAMPVSTVDAAFAPCTRDALYAMPYRGYEGQRGTPNERDLVADGVALVQKAQAEHRVVRVLGISLGTGVAVQVAAQTHPQSLLLVTPFASLAGTAAAHYPWVPVRWLLRDAYDSAGAAPRLAGVPVAVLQADRDEVIPASQTQALVHAIPGGPVAWVHAPTTHNGVWESPVLCQWLHQQTRPMG